MSAAPTRCPKQYASTFIFRSKNIFISTGRTAERKVSADPTRYSEICEHFVFWYKMFWTEKQKFSHTIEVTALVPLTPPFHLFDLQKSRFQKKLFWTEKRKCSYTDEGTSLVLLTTHFHLCEIQKSRYRRKLFCLKHENTRILIRAPRWYR